MTLIRTWSEMMSEGECERERAENEGVPSLFGSVSIAAAAFVTEGGVGCTLSYCWP